MMSLSTFEGGFLGQKKNVENGMKIGAVREFWEPKFAGKEPHFPGNRTLFITLYSFWNTG